MKVLGLEFAPLFISTRRRLQTVAVMQAVATFLCGGVISLLFTR